MSEADNPCQSCPDTCCALKGHTGLRLAREEFETHFQAHARDLLVRVEDKLTIISTREGRKCPNLGEKGCLVYETRPIDCRLYPYQMHPVYETRGKAKFLLYVLPVCVENKVFHIPESEAKALVVEFGSKAYGGKRIVVQIYRDAFFSKAWNKCTMILVKLCKKVGIPL